MRYILDHQWPGCNIPTGAIFTDNSGYAIYQREGCEVTTVIKTAEITASIESGCNAFRMLNWWEGKPAGELPKYVSLADWEATPNICKVERYHIEGGKVWVIGDSGKIQLESGDLEATEQEYNEYLKRINNG